MSPAAAVDVGAVLRQRAALLARPLPRDDADAVDVLAFTLAGRTCAIAIDVLTEVRMLARIVPLPFAAAGILGTVHVHGRMLPVIELAGRLQLPPPAAPPRLLVVLGRERPAFAFAAEAVAGLRRMSAAAAKRRAAPVEQIQPPLVIGIGPQQELLLDGAALLATALEPGQKETSA